jgi:hypothetical protein
VGRLAEATGIHREYQANSTRTRRVLSLFSLGKEVIRRAEWHAMPGLVHAMRHSRPWNVDRKRGDP